MKILIYSPLFYPSVGGIEVLTEQLAINFFKKGIEVIVITQVKKPNYKKFEFKVLYQPNFSAILKAYIWSDILFMPNISLKVCWLFFFNPFKKWVISHNSRYFDPETKNYINSVLKQIFLVKATNIAVSKDIANSLWVKSTVIYNCYNDSIFFNRYLNREYTFLFVGRLVSSKGATELINAFYKLRLTNKDLTLAIVGSGPEEPTILSLIDKYQLKESVTYYGNLPQYDVALIMNKSNCLVVPSIGSEAFGIVVLEGLACGCKIITSDSTGLVEANSGFGITYTLKEKDGLLQALSFYLDSFSSIENDSNKLSEYLTSHSVDKVANTYLKIMGFE